MQNNFFRVMHVVSNLDIGGGQEVVRTLSEHMVREGCFPVVCTFKDGPLRREIERLGIRVEILTGRRYDILAFPLFLIEMLRLRRILVSLVEKHKIDIIQTHMLRSLDFLVLTLRYRRNLLVFSTFQNSNFVLREDQLLRHKWLLSPKRAAYRVLYRLAARWTNGFIAVSEDVRTALLKQFGSVQDKITVIFNSVDIKRYQRSVDRAYIRGQLGLPVNWRVIAVVATFKKQKGHCYLIEAVRPIISRFPDLHILFIGDGDLREQLHAQTRASGLDEHIHFLGSRSDVPDLLAASDYFVLPSLWEGLPMALVEAMASGLPVIATEVSGTRQVMVPNETGLLVPPGNSDQLREGIIYLLTHPIKARAMGKAGRQRVEEFFSAKKQAEALIALYRCEWRRINGYES